MEAVPRMPMIWLDLKEAGEFPFSPSVKQVSWAAGRGRGGMERSNRALRSKANQTGIMEDWIN